MKLNFSLFFRNVDFPIGRYICAHPFICL